MPDKQPTMMTIREVARTVREFIEKIVVYQSTRGEGRKVQKLRIYYKCIGAVDIPMVIEEKKWPALLC